MLPDFRVRQRDYLLEIALALTQELDLDILLGRILTISIDMLSGQAGLIALRSTQGSGGWRARVSQGLPPAFLSYIEPLLSNIPASSEPQPELPEINRIVQELTRMASMGSLTGVGLPLIARQQVVGVILIYRNNPNLFSANDQALLASFANQAAIAVQNAQLYTQATQARQRTDALLDSAADGLMILGPDQKIERCNQALERMLNSPPGQLQGQVHEAVIRWTAPPQGQTLENAIADGWPLTANANLYVEGDLARGKDMGPLPVGITYAPLLSPEGVLLNIIATLRDITRFRQADELKSTFISIVSHELKTPVALIKGYTSTLRRDDATWDREIVDESLQVIEDEADRLSSLIENLLDASRLQAGGFKIKRAEVCLPAVARRMAERFQTQTSQHTLLVDFSDDYPVVLADEKRLEQVFSNLISNAIKYAPGGVINISGQVRPDQVVICVSDEGPGIAPPDVPHVFDSFYRAPEMARSTKGAGLGLFLTRAIIEAHGGRIWVDSHVGSGARICFSLPR